MSDRIERWALLLLIAFSVCAVLGFATFGQHPELLRANPMGQRFYGTAFLLFARGQVLVAAAVLFMVLVRRVRLAWVPALVVIYVASLASELSGTTTGLPFGAYSYTDALGPKWFGHVPLLIPLSWFLMAVPSFAIAGRLAGDRRVARILAGSIVLLAWDLALDPAMSFATKYWVWGETGPYYGMPLLNLVGWYATGLVLMTLLALLRSERWVALLPHRWVVGFYLANLGLALGLCAGARLYGAVLASAIPLALAGFALRDRAAQGESQREMAAA